MLTENENDARATLSKNFMRNEAEAQRMKAEIGGGQASGNPAPTPDNAEPKPDNAAPEANSPEPKASGKQFADVSNTAYYYDAVYWALRQNITEGVTDTAFPPNDACTRAQILTFIWRTPENRSRPFPIRSMTYQPTTIITGE